MYFLFNLIIISSNQTTPTFNAGVCRKITESSIYFVFSFTWCGRTRVKDHPHHKPLWVHAHNGQKLNAFSLAAKRRAAPPSVLHSSIPILAPLQHPVIQFTVWDSCNMPCNLEQSIAYQIFIDVRRDVEDRSGNRRKMENKKRIVRQRRGGGTTLLVAVLLCCGPWRKQCSSF